MSKQENKSMKNLFGTVLTYPAPSANYRGESEENRTVLQKISKNGKDYAVFSSEAKRNALREILLEKNVLSNRTRLHNEGQLAVEFKEFPNPEKYADDFIFGYMVADSKYLPKDRKNATLKRDSVLRINNSVALSPYKYEATFHQSPLNAKTKVNENNFWSNQSTSVLLHKEISHTAFQYPFALAGNDCIEKPDWIKALLEAGNSVPLETSPETRPLEAGNSVPPAARFEPPVRQTPVVLSSRATHAADAHCSRFATLQSFVAHRAARRTPARSNTHLESAR
jgi:CRISPR-associated protein Cst2